MGFRCRTLWLYYFNTKIGQGYTIANACSYADTFNYTDNDVKWHTCYGDPYHNPMYYIDPSLLMTPEYEEREHTTIDAGTDALENINNYLLKKEGNIEDFSYYKTEKEFLYYDCALSYLDVRTDYAYTFCIQDDIIKVYDNTQNQNAETIREKIEAFYEIHSYDSISLQQATEKENFLKSVDGTVETLEQYILFSCADDCFYSVLDYVAKDPDGLHFADSVLCPIKE